MDALRTGAVIVTKTSHASDSQSNMRATHLHSAGKRETLLHMVSRVHKPHSTRVTTLPPSSSYASRLVFSCSKQWGGEGIAKETALRSAKWTAKMCHSAQASAWSEQRPIIVEILFDFFAYMAQNGPQVNRQNSMKNQNGAKPLDIKIRVKLARMNP